MNLKIFIFDKAVLNAELKEITNMDYVKGRLIRYYPERITVDNPLCKIMIENIPLNPYSNKNNYTLFNPLNEFIEKRI